MLRTGANTCPIRYLNPMHLISCEDRPWQWPGPDCVQMLGKRKLVAKETPSAVEKRLLEQGVVKHAGVRWREQMEWQLRFQCHTEDRWQYGHHFVLLLTSAHLCSVLLMGCELVKSHLHTANVLGQTGLRMCTIYFRLILMVNANLKVDMGICQRLGLNFGHTFFKWQLHALQLPLRTRWRRLYLLGYLFDIPVWNVVCVLMSDE